MMLGKNMSVEDAKNICEMFKLDVKEVLSSEAYTMECGNSEDAEITTEMLGVKKVEEYGLMDGDELKVLMQEVVYKNEETGLLGFIYNTMNIGTDIIYSVVKLDEEMQVQDVIKLY